MSLGRYVSDLEKGDVLDPVTYEMTPFVVREYCHGTDESREEFHAAVGQGGAQYAPPTLAHIDKIRLINKSCPEGAGPHARVHVQFHSRQHRLIPVGETLVASGVVSDRYEKRGRTYLDLEIELRTVESGELILQYWDTAILSYVQAEA